MNATWYEDIAGATGASFTLGQPQVGRFVRVVASWVDGGGTREAVVSPITAEPVANVNDVPTGTVSISGTPKAGQMLDAAAALVDPDGLGTIRFEWQSSPDGKTWTAVAGADQSSFMPPAALSGLRLRAVAHYVDGFGTAESVPSAATQLLVTLEGTAGNDALTGGEGADEINGLAGHDRLRGGAGDDWIIGGDGIDTALYARPRADYRVGTAGASVLALAGDEGSDTLQQVERIAFADQSLAFDLTGQAGAVARILGAVFGPAALSNKVYAGIGLQQLGQGVAVSDLMQLALNVRLGNGFSSADEIRLLYQNIMATAPSTDELNFWLGSLSAGQFTQASLAMMAANTDFTARAIDLVGLAGSGLAFVPA